MRAVGSFAADTINNFAYVFITTVAADEPRFLVRSRRYFVRLYAVFSRMPFKGDVGSLAQQRFTYCASLVSPYTLGRRGCEAVSLGAYPVIHLSLIHIFLELRYRDIIHIKNLGPMQRQEVAAGLHYYGVIETEWDFFRPKTKTE